MAVLKLPVSSAGSDGRRNTSLIDWAHNTFSEEPLFWLSSIRPKQGSVFFKSTFANEFSLFKILQIYFDLVLHRPIESTRCIGNVGSPSTRSRLKSYLRWSAYSAANFSS